MKWRLKCTTRYERERFKGVILIRGQNNISINLVNLIQMRKHLKSRKNRIARH